MEINLSDIGRNIKAVFIWFSIKPTTTWNKLAGKRAISRHAKSRRFKGNKLTKQELGLRKIKIMRFVAFGMLGVVILGITSFFILFAYFARQLPEPGKIVRYEGFSSKIYDRNGELLYDLYKSVLQIFTSSKS